MQGLVLLLGCCCFAGGGEVNSVFKGYISRDRRKPHIVEADRAAEQLLRRARAAGKESSLHLSLGCMSVAPLSLSSPLACSFFVVLLC
jgi:hypothetical protein